MNRALICACIFVERPPESLDQDAVRFELLQSPIRVHGDCVCAPVPSLLISVFLPTLTITIAMEIKRDDTCKVFITVVRI